MKERKRKQKRREERREKDESVWSVKKSAGVVGRTPVWAPLEGRPLSWTKDNKWVNDEVPGSTVYCSRKYLE